MSGFQDAFKAGQLFAKNLSKSTGTFDSAFSDSCGMNTSQNDLDQVTSRLQQVDGSQTLLSRVQPLSSDSVLVSSDSEIRSTNGVCDNYAKLDFVGDNAKSTVVDVTSVTNAYNSNTSDGCSSGHVADPTNAHSRLQSKTELANTETIVESLLNSIVRLARASVNLNILSINKEDMKMKNNGEFRLM